MNYLDLAIGKSNETEIRDVGNEAEYGLVKKYKNVFVADFPTFGIKEEIPSLKFMGEVIKVSETSQLGEIVEFLQEKAKSLAAESYGTAGVITAFNSGTREITITDATSTGSKEFMAGDLINDDHDFTGVIESIDFNNNIIVVKSGYIGTPVVGDNVFNKQEDLTPKKIKILCFCEALKNNQANDVDIIFVRDDEWNDTGDFNTHMKLSIGTGLKSFGFGVISNQGHTFKEFLEDKGEKMLETFNGYLSEVLTYNSSKPTIGDLFWEDTKYKKYFGKKTGVDSEKLFFNTTTLNYSLKNILLNRWGSYFNLMKSEIEGLMIGKIDQLYAPIVSPVNFLKVSVETLEKYGISGDTFCEYPVTEIDDGIYTVEKESFSYNTNATLDYIIFPESEGSDYRIIFSPETVVNAGVLYSNLLKQAGNRTSRYLDIYLDSSINYSGFSFIENNIMQTSDRKDLEPYKVGQLINGIMPEHDITGSVVGSNFAFLAYNYCENKFKGNAINYTGLAKELEKKINSIIDGMEDILPESIQRSVSVSEEKGKYYAKVKLVNTDKNKEYKFIINLV